MFFFLKLKLCCTCYYPIYKETNRIFWHGYFKEALKVQKLLFVHSRTDIKFQKKDAIKQTKFYIKSY